MKFIRIREKIVALYRYIGLLILITVLLVVGGYFSLVGFFVFNRHWAIPTILSPKSEKTLVYVGKYLTIKSRLEELKAQYKDTGKNEKLIEEFSEIIRGIETSPYYEATKRKVALAFIPYDNLVNIAYKDEVYACKLYIIFCYNIGIVDSIIDGEHIQPHPLFDKEVRGRMVKLDIKNINDARKHIVHVGYKPFLF